MWQFSFSINVIRLEMAIRFLEYTLYELKTFCIRKSVSLGPRIRPHNEFQSFHRFFFFDLSYRLRKCIKRFSRFIDEHHAFGSRLCTSWNRLIQLSNIHNDSIDFLLQFFIDSIFHLWTFLKRLPDEFYNWHCHFIFKHLHFHIIFKHLFYFFFSWYSTAYIHYPLILSFEYAK